ncbi:hypothetical protein FRB95_014297, partial [Tulasnella sp. JGI-2019a]
SASNKDNVITVADNIPLISDFEAVRLIARSTALETLLSHLQKSIQDVQSRNDEMDLTATLTLARAVAHVLLADPKRASEAARRFLMGLETGTSYHFIPLELHMLLRCVQTMCTLVIEREMMGGSIFAYIQHTNFHNSTWKHFLPSGAKELQNNHPNSTAILWLRQCIVAAAYNRWHEQTMDNLAENLRDWILFEGLRPDSFYLCVAMDALLAILRWYTLWGRRNGHASLDDSTNLKSAWTVPE